MSPTVAAFAYPDEASQLEAYQRARAEVERGLDRPDGASVYRVRDVEATRFIVAVVTDDPRLLDAVEWSPGEPYHLSGPEAGALAQRRIDVGIARPDGSRWTERHYGPDGAYLWPDGEVRPR
jgi:hypothetical protein